jgi:acetylornithine deacetylase
MTDNDLLARLIGYDTTSSESNLPLVDFLSGYLELPSVRIDRNLSEDGSKANLIVRMGPDPGAERRGLVLAAHTDTVPAGGGWSTDPFTLTAAGDRYFGRGTADMKGFLALAVNALARTDPDGLRAPLALILTYDEEIGLRGARRLAETWTEPDQLPRHAVIGEPTSLRAVRMHKGYVDLRVTVGGISAHSGYPHRGVNAIEPAARVITALGDLREELAAARPPHCENFPETPFVALNVGRVSGGIAINVVPDRCTVEASLRPLPEMDSGALVARVRRVVEAAAGEAQFDFEPVNESPPLLLKEDAPIYRAVCRLVDQRQTVGVSYATDAAWLQRLGMDCVVFGPGSIEVAHKPDEFIPADELRRGSEFLERLIGQFCLEPPG